MRGGLSFIHARSTPSPPGAEAVCDPGDAVLVLFVCRRANARIIRGGPSFFEMARESAVAVGQLRE